jgi:hypothetical protein
VTAVRWDALFADLEGQFAAAEAAELADEVADRTRREVARLRIVDRLRPAIGRSISVSVAPTGRVEGGLTAVGPDWLLVSEPGRDALVPLAAVTAVDGLGPDVSAPDTEGVVAGRLDLRYALRGIARNRSPVAIDLTDGNLLTGTIDRVGHDFVELAEHLAGEVRRRGDLRRMRLVPVGAIAIVRAG